MATKYEMKLVHSEESLRDWIEAEIKAHDPYEKISMCNKFSIFVGDQRVVFCNSSKVTGRNKTTGARYYRWETESVDTFYRDRLGRITARRMHAPGKYSVVDFATYVAPHPNSWNKDLIARIERKNRILEEVFGQSVSYETIYPLASHWQIAHGMDWSIPPGMRPALKNSNLREFCEQVFGKSRTRRDLMRAVGGSDCLPAIFVAAEFKGLVPVDWMARFINNNHTNLNWQHANFGVLRPLLNRMDPKSYRSLLFDPNVPVHEIRDISLVNYGIQRDYDYYGNLAARRWRSWHEFHNGLFPHNYNRRYIQPVEPQEIPKTPISQQLDGLAVGGYKIVTPAMTTDLLNWGSSMGNCIGSYASRVVSDKRDTELGGIYQGDKLVANFEIHRGRLNQFLGKFNEPLRSVASLFEPEFQRLGIEVPDKYWGRE